MDEEFSIDNFTPFITRSRTVTRLLPEPIYAHSPLANPEKRYGPEFWDQLIRQPSVYHTGVTGSRRYGKCDYMASPLLDPLPPPSEVFRGKKKQKSHADRGVISVENHIQDLRKKQGSIDQLKTMKWGGYNSYEVENNEGTQSYGTRADQEQDNFFSFLDDVTEKDRPMFNFSPPRSPGGVVFPWITPKEDFSPCFLDRTYDGCETDGGFALNTMQWGGNSIRGLKNNEGMQSNGCRPVQKRHTFFSFLDDEVGCSEKDVPLFSFSSPRSPGGAVFPWITPKEDVSTCFLDRTYDG